jgi:hypothetical protein
MSLGLLLDEQAGLHGADDLADSLPLHGPQLHQATGMISAQPDVAMDDAFARLRARAFADQRPLAELAADVVYRRLRFDPLMRCRELSRSVCGTAVRWWARWR